MSEEWRLDPYEEFYLYVKCARQFVSNWLAFDIYCFVRLCELVILVQVQV